MPHGPAATIDGMLSEGEWDGAKRIILDEDQSLHLMHGGGYLFLGIASDAMGYGSLCVARGEEVSILHASAALGTAVYLREEQGWSRTREFSWCCRERYPGPRQVEHLEAEGWLASIGYMGHRREMEYQIAMPEGGLVMAIVHQSGPDVEDALRWPETLDDDCIHMLGSFDDQDLLNFLPEMWPLFIAAAE